MSKTTARNRSLLIAKLRELHFTGPVAVAGQEFMIYHGQTFALPKEEHLSVAQFRFVLKKIEEMISPAEWSF